MWFRVLAKRTIPQVLYRTGLLRRVDGPKTGSFLLALNYHSVDPVVFESHANFLTKRTQVIDPVDLENQVSATKATGKPRIVLTFDDGYANFVHDIHPILKRYGLPALWFVPTDYLGSSEGFWFDRVRLAVGSSRSKHLELGDKKWRIPRGNRDLVSNQITAHLKTLTPNHLDAAVSGILRQTGVPPSHMLDARRIATEDEVRSVDGRGVHVASHSRTHRNLPVLDDGELENELVGSKRRLESLLGRRIDHFAFPSGDYDDRVIAGLKTAGYRWAWTTDPGFVRTTDLPYQIPRVLIDDHDSDPILAAKMSPSMHRIGVVR